MTKNNTQNQDKQKPTNHTHTQNQGKTKEKPTRPMAYGTYHYVCSDIWRVEQQLYIKVRVALRQLSEP